MQDKDKNTAYYQEAILNQLQKSYKLKWHFSADFSFFDVTLLS